MRKNLKRLLCLALAVVMTLGTLPTTAMAGFGSGNQTLPGGGGFGLPAADGVPYNSDNTTFLRFTLVEFPNGIDATDAIETANVLRSVDIINSAEGGGKPNDNDKNAAFTFKSLHPTNALDYYRAYTFGYGDKTGMDAVGAYYQSGDRSWDGSDIKYSRYTSAQFRHMLGIQYGQSLSVDGSTELRTDLFNFMGTRWGSGFFPGFTDGTGTSVFTTIFGKAASESDIGPTGYEPNKVMELLWYLMWFAPSVSDVKSTAAGTNFNLVNSTVSINGKPETMRNFLRGEGTCPSDVSFYKKTSDGKSVYRIIVETGFVASFNSGNDDLSQHQQLTCRDWTTHCRNDSWTNAGFPIKMYRTLYSTSDPSALFGYPRQGGFDLKNVYYNREGAFKPTNPNVDAPEDSRTFAQMADLLFKQNKGGGMCVMTPDDQKPWDDRLEPTEVSLSVTKTAMDGTNKGLSAETLAYVYPMVAVVDLSEYVAEYGAISDVKGAFEVLIQESGKDDIVLDASNFTVSSDNANQVNIYFGLKSGQTAEIKISLPLRAGASADDAVSKIVYAVQEQAGTKVGAAADKTWIGNKVTGDTGSHPGGSLAKLDDVYQYGMATSIKVNSSGEASRMDNIFNDISSLAEDYGNNKFSKTMELNKFYHAEKDEAGTYQNAMVMGRLGMSTEVTFTNQWHTPRTLELSWKVTKDASFIINHYLDEDPGATYVNNWAYPFYFSFDATGMTKKVDGSKISIKGVTVTNEDGKWLGDGYRAYNTAAEAAKFNPAREELFGTFVLRSGDTATVTVTVNVNDLKLSQIKDLPGLARFAATETYPWTDSAAAEMNVNNADYTEYMKARAMRDYFLMFAREDSAYGNAATRSALKSYLESYQTPPYTMPDFGTGTLEGIIKTTMYPTPLVYNLQGGIVTSVTSSDGFKWLDMDSMVHLSDVENTNTKDPANPVVADLSPVTGATVVTDAEQPFSDNGQIGYIEGVNGKAVLDSATGNYVTNNPPEVVFTNAPPEHDEPQVVEVEFELTKTVSGAINITTVDDPETYANTKAIYPFYVSFDYSKITESVEFDSVSVTGVDGSWVVTEGNKPAKQAYAWIGMKAGETAKVTLKLRLTAASDLTDADIAAIQDQVVYGIEECTQWSGAPGMTSANIDFIRFMPENARRLWFKYAGLDPSDYPAPNFTNSAGKRADQAAFDAGKGMPFISYTAMRNAGSPMTVSVSSSTMQRAALTGSQLNGLAGTSITAAEKDTAIPYTTPAAAVGSGTGKKATFANSWPEQPRAVHVLIDWNMNGIEIKDYLSGLYVW